MCIIHFTCVCPSVRLSDRTEPDCRVVCHSFYIICVCVRPPIWAGLDWIRWLSLIHSIANFRPEHFLCEHRPALTIMTAPKQSQISIYHTSMLDPEGAHSRASRRGTVEATMPSWLSKRLEPMASQIVAATSPANASPEKKRKQCHGGTDDAEAELPDDPWDVPTVAWLADNVPFASGWPRGIPMTPRLPPAAVLVEPGDGPQAAHSGWLASCRSGWLPPAVPPAHSGMHPLRLVPAEPEDVPTDSNMPNWVNLVQAPDHNTRRMMMARAEEANKAEEDYM